MSNVVSLDKTFKEQPVDQVVTYDNSDIFTPIGAFGRRYNPDELISKKGIHIYGQMMHDEQCKAVVEFKSGAILGRGWEFYFDEDSELSEEEKKERIKVFQTIIRKMRGSFHDVLDGIGSGREFGYSVSEKIYATIKIGGKAYTGLNKIVIRNPDSFEFYTDEFGEITKIHQRSRGTGAEIPVDTAKLIHYVHKPKWDVIYGRSDLRAAYRSWYCKDTLIKLWVLYLEKFGGGTIIGTRSAEANLVPGTAAHTALENAFKNIQSLKSVLLPPGVTAEIHFPNANDGYEKAITFFDLAIAKSLLVPNLLGLSHTGSTGAFAQSQTQLEAFYWTLLMDATRLSDTVNEQLFKDLGDQNWGDGEYPLFRFKKSSLDQIKWIVETWKGLVKDGTVINTETDEAFLRNLMDMPAREEDSVELVSQKEEKKMALEEEVARNGMANVAQVAEEAKKQAPEVKAAIENMIKEIVDVRETLEKQANSERDITVNNNIATPVPAASNNDDPLGNIHFHGDMYGVSQGAARKAAARVAFAVIGKRTEDIAALAVDELGLTLARAVKKALGDDASITAFLDDDTTDVAAFELAATDVGKLKAQYNGILRRGWQLGSEHARNEIDKAAATAKRSITSANRVSAASLRDKAASYFDNQAFRMAGDTSDKTKKIIQQELQNGIKFSKPNDEVAANIWNRLVQQGMTKKQIARGVETDAAVNKALDKLWQDTEEGAMSYLNTLVRTNTFEALNEARYAEFTDPALADFIVGLQYAAVLDESTSEICHELGTEGPDGDGVIWATDSELWDTYRPPNHFNCRSILVPISVDDGWDGEESEEPINDPQEGFA